MPRGVGLNWMYDEAQLQGRLWTPDVLRTSIWFDAADRSTLTLVSGNASEWRDKSGNRRHVSQAMAANRPTYAESGLNGRPTLDWGTDANSKTLVNTTAFSNFNPKRFFAVADYDGPNPPTEYFGLIRPNFTSSIDWVAVMNINTLTWFTNTQFHNGSPTATLNAAPILHPFVLVNNTDCNTNRTTLNIGLDTGAANRGWRGKISEVIAIDYVPSVAERNLTEGYLAWKRNIPLNASHPFVNRPPLIGD